MWLRRKLGEKYTCVVCGDLYPLEHGSQITCSPLCKAVRRQEKDTAYKKYSYHHRGEVKKRYVKKSKEYYVENKEECLQATQAYYKKNRESIMLRMNERYRKKKEMMVRENSK